MADAFSLLGNAPITDDTNYLTDEIQFDIDSNLRTIAIPTAGVVIGVTGDKNVNRVNFRMPAWYNGFDMSKFSPRINFIDPEGNVNYYTVTDMTVYNSDNEIVTGTPTTSDTIYFTWLVDSYATKYVGSVVFNVRFTKFNSTTNALEQAFNTTKATCTVLEGITLAGEISQDEQEDLLFHMTAELQDVTDGLELDIQQKGAATLAAIETKGETTLESIPDDYSTLSSEISDVKSDLYQYYEVIEGKYVAYSNGAILDYSGLKTLVMPVSEGIKVKYDYTYPAPDLRGAAFYDVNGGFVSGVQTKTTSQEFNVPSNSVTMKITVTEENQVSISQMAKAISALNTKIKNASSDTLTNAIANSLSPSKVLVDRYSVLPDANSATNNKIYMILSSKYVSNLPYSNDIGGTLITFHYGGSEYTLSRTQIFITTLNEMWYRIEWGAGWQSWSKSAKDGSMSYNEVVTSTNITDLNNANLNGYYIINDTNILNLPSNSKGSLLCYCGYPNNTAADVTGGRVQLFVDIANNIFYRSSVFTSTLMWTGWVQINQSSNPNSPIAENMTATPLEHITEDVGLLRCFDTVGCIGDSLSSGECAYKDSNGNAHYIDMYEISWGQCLARMTGRTYYNFSTGGLSAKDFMTTNHEKVRQFDDGSHICKMYFIGLGQNDYNQSVPIGTSADVNSNSPTTYYGYYGKIIRKIKEMQPKAKIFVITDPLSAIETGGYNAAVRNMANLFSNVYLIDMYTYANGIYKGDNTFINKNYRQYHYNAVGYQTMAYIISTYVNWIMKNNPNEFREIEFIGTEYSYF